MTLEQTIKVFFDFSLFFLAAFVIALVAEAIGVVLEKVLGIRLK